MKIEDYTKYYIQGSDHYLIPKDIFKELFNEMESWKQDTNKYKEVIDKAIEYINENLIISSILDGKKYYTISDYSFDYRELLDILNEVTNNE